MTTKRPSLHPGERGGVSILGTGAYLPEKVLTNFDLEKMVDTSDEWITSRTGIKERRIAAPEETSSDMGLQAAQRALKSSGLKAEELGLILVATSTPDTTFPATACYIQHRLGARRAVAFDLQAACSGFLVALVTAEQYVRGGLCRYALVIGSEKLSSIVNWEDRNTCVLFGDGAGAVVVGAAEGRAGILASDLGTDGAQTEILTLAASGAIGEDGHPGRAYIQMSGKEVYRHAVTAMNRSAEAVLQRAELTPEGIKWVIPHQANLRIISAVAERLEIPLGRFILNLERCGNTSAACIPMALDEACRDGRLKRGDRILMVAFGSGLTWASVVLEW